jgi:phage shock protein A
MNLADRFFRVVKANINSIIQNLEDPEKVLEQAVDDMQNDLIKIRQSYAEVSATQKRYGCMHAMLRYQCSGGWLVSSI